MPFTQVKTQSSTLRTAGTSAASRPPGRFVLPTTPFRRLVKPPKRVRSPYPQPPLPANTLVALHTLTRQARRRIRLTRLLRVLPLSLLCAAAVAALMLLAGKGQQISYPAAWVWAVPTLTPLAVSAAYALRPRLSALDVARQLERRAGLQERFSSAIEFQTQRVDLTLPFYAAQWADADQCAAQLNLQPLFPLKTGRALAAAAAAVLFVFIACRAPAPPFRAHSSEKAQTQQEAATVSAAGTRLQKKADEATAEARRHDMPRTTQAAQAAAGLALRMRHSRLDKRQSLVALQKLTQRFEQEIKKMDAQRAGVLNAQPALPPILPAALSSRLVSDSASPQRTTASAPSQTHQPTRSDDLPHDRQSPSKPSKTVMPPSAQGRPTQQTQQPGQRTEQPLSQAASANDISTPGKLQITRDTEGLRRMTMALQDTRRQISRSGMAGSGGRDPGQGVNGLAQTFHNAPVSENQTPRSMSRSLPSAKRQANTMAGVKASSSFKVLPRAAANPPDARAGKTPSEQDSEMPAEASSAPPPAYTHTPYYTPHETDRRQAESALSRENVPAAYKQQVKAYFDSINAPGRRSNGPK